jgi:hypothetical protein
MRFPSRPLMGAAAGRGTRGPALVSVAGVAGGGRLALGGWRGSVSGCGRGAARRGAGQSQADTCRAPVFMIVKDLQPISCFIYMKRKSFAIMTRRHADLAHQPAHGPHGHLAPLTRCLTLDGNEPAAAGSEEVPHPTACPDEPALRGLPSRGPASRGDASPSQRTTRAPGKAPHRPNARSGLA